MFFIHIPIFISWFLVHRSTLHTNTITLFVPVMITSSVFMAVWGGVVEDIDSMMEVQPVFSLRLLCASHLRALFICFKIYDLFIAEDLPYLGQSLARAHKNSTQQQQEYRLALCRVYIRVIIKVKKRALSSLSL